MPNIEGYSVTKAHDPLAVVMSEEDLSDIQEKSERKKHKYDKPEYTNRVLKVREWWNQSRDALTDSREQSIMDNEYYDNEQWTEEEKQILNDRGQDATVFNQIGTAIDWILGTERKNRIDWNVLPREKNDVAGAEAKTKLLKYVSDVSDIPGKRSLAFEDTVKAGVGWLETGIVNDNTKDILCVEYEDWRNIWYDPLSIRPDLSDARYIFRSKWVDLDMAMSMFPERAAKIRVESGNYRDNETHQSFEDYIEFENEVSSIDDINTDPDGRARVKLVECWYRTPKKVQILRGDILGAFDGMTYDDQDEAMQGLIDDESVTLVDSMQMQIRCMLFTGNIVLHDDVSPYHHNKFPFIPIWAKRRKKTGAPYGPIRNMRSPQDDLNKRRSKALHILSTNKIIADDDATDDWEEFQEEASRPDGVVRKKRGSDVQIFNETALAEAHTRLMQQDAEYIMDASGVTNENLGRDTNAISGKAISAKQEQGMTVTNRLFDNHRRAFRQLGEILLSLIEQYYGEEKIVRITGDKGRPEWLEINQMQPDGEVLNDITASKADFIVTEDSYNASLRASMFETLSEMATRLPPDITIQILDMIIDLSDMPGKKELIARIREINGMDDPFADPEDPEAMQKKQAKDQQKAEEVEMQKQQAVAEIQKSKAEAEKAKYEAEKAHYEAMKELASVDTEKANQEATRAGISFDRTKLRIEKAKALHAIRSGRKEASQEKSTPIKQEKDMREKQYNERGMKSNNEVK